MHGCDSGGSRREGGDGSTNRDLSRPTPSHGCARVRGPAPGAIPCVLMCSLARDHGHVHTNKSFAVASFDLVTILSCSLDLYAPWLHEQHVHTSAFHLGVRSSSPLWFHGVLFLVHVQVCRDWPPTKKGNVPGTQSSVFVPLIACVIGPIDGFCTAAGGFKRARSLNLRFCASHCLVLYAPVFVL